jgi:hypothetical protein
MPFTDSDLKWFAARLSIAVHETNREYSMGIGGDLKARLSAIPGIEEATSDIEGGQRVFKISGKTIAVGRFAFDNEIEQAIRKAFGMSDEIHTTELPAVPLIVAAPEPVVEAPKPAGKPIPASGGYQPGSLKALLQGLRDRNQMVMSETVEKVQKAHKALDQVAQIGNDAEATAQAILSEIGQFSNFPE